MTLSQVKVQQNLDYLVKKNTVVTRDQTREMSAEEFNETVQTTVSCLLRSHVIYKIMDNTEYHSVTVAIFSTPMTENAMTRNSSLFVDAKDLAEGTKKITEEVFSGVTPPVGGKIVTIPGTRAIALISYGSAPIYYSKDTYKQRQKQLEATKKAEAYAQAAMLNLIKGEQVDRKFETLGIDKTSLSDYEDAIENASTQDVNRLEEQNDNFAEIITSRQSGILPAGIASRTWIDEKNGWAYVAKIYIPATKEPVVVTSQPAAAPKPAAAPQPVVEEKEVTIMTGNVTSPSDF